jgi:hypothetical protein
MSTKPPPLPPGAKPPGSTSDSYDQFADKVGLVPNVRKKDNLYQGIAVVAGLLLGALVGWLWKDTFEAALLGALIGLVGATLVSGLVLLVLGLKRKS